MVYRLQLVILSAIFNHNCVIHLCVLWYCLLPAHKSPNMCVIFMNMSCTYCFSPASTFHPFYTTHVVPFTSLSWACLMVVVSCLPSTPQSQSLLHFWHRVDCGGFFSASTISRCGLRGGFVAASSSSISSKVWFIVTSSEGSVPQSWGGSNSHSHFFLKYSRSSRN